MIGATIPTRFRLSPNFEMRPAGITPSLIVMHYTGMESAERACAWLCSPMSKVSCHYLVDEEGKITQMVDEDFRAWHAGVSNWKGEADINSHSIGIEVQNPGHGPYYQDYSELQMLAVAALAFDIVVRYRIDAKAVLAHSDVAPGRKVDPGEKFDWKLLNKYGIGHWVQPAPIRAGIELRRGADGDDVEELQRMLAAYGYGITPNGVYDQHTETVVKAFQLHFRPELVDGVADLSTLVTLEKLLLS